ncbi:HNH endonuclease [Mesorhizobium helmanticense]|uniref:HNH endonuclease n=1 Tax=Mesorhizobium helmanticense TaxID=1776423 RepID=A0A2T4J1S0_9HYPH|nr:hypothetical protein [Mesorhizobium helmanticense]PTE11773.1 hypothetical protein C9427_03540 [Mesorhizobium helmanticense]
MKTLVPLAPDYLARYIVIRDSKYNPTKKTLIDNEMAISARYQALDNRAAAGDLEIIGASPLLAISAALRHCYGSETLALLALKQEIKAAQPQRQLKYCPYCGTTTNETYDHYLPASQFPEFSVHALNLVPCCFRCNTIKDDDWLNALGERQYLHFYLDPIPEAQFLRADLVVRPPLVAVGAHFRLDQNGIENATWTRIQRHFDRLHLIDRYNENANDEIGEMLDGGAAYVGAGGTDVAEFLALQAASNQQIFGINHWRSVLLWQLSAHPDIESWVGAAYRQRGPSNAIRRRVHRAGKRHDA